MTEPIYTLKPWHNSDQHYLVKWGDSLEAHKAPLDTYFMSKNYCGCPSPRHPCKHMAIRDALLEEAKHRNVPVWTIGYQDGSIFELWDTLLLVLTADYW